MGIVVLHQKFQVCAFIKIHYYRKSCLKPRGGLLNFWGSRDVGLLQWSLFKESLEKKFFNLKYSVRNLQFYNVMHPAAIPNPSHLTLLSFFYEEGGLAFTVDWFLCHTCVETSLFPNSRCKVSSFWHFYEFSRSLCWNF